MLVLTGVAGASLIDADHQLLPDVLVLLLQIVAVKQLLIVSNLPDAVYGRFGYLSLVGFLVVQADHRQEGMGYGDFKPLNMLEPGAAGSVS